jgi:hypothetical protein
MRKTYFSEVRLDEGTHRQVKVEYRYEPSESGDGPGRFFEARYKLGFPWRRLLLLVGYLMGVSGAEIAMAVDNVRVGVGLLILVVGAFLALTSATSRLTIVRQPAREPYLVREIQLPRINADDYPPS